MGQGWRPDITPERLAETESEIAAVTKIRDTLDFSFTEEKSPLYKVDLAPAEDEYLLWDKPLAAIEQVQRKCKDALRLAWADHHRSRWSNGRNHTSDRTEVDDPTHTASSVYRHSGELSHEKARS